MIVIFIDFRQMIDCEKGNLSTEVKDSWAIRF